MKLVSECQQEPELCSTMPVKEALHANTKTAKAVSFSATMTQVNEVMSHHDYTEEELHATWYQKKDYKAFKRTVLTTLKLNRAGELPEGGNDEYTMRGIECRTREGAAARKAIKHQVKTAVLEEQARQRQQQQQQQQADLLALVSQQQTKDSQLEASIHGMCDELEARDHPRLAQSVSVATHAHYKMSASRRTVRLQDVDLQSGLRLVAGSAA